MTDVPDGRGRESLPPVMPDRRQLGRIDAELLVCTRCVVEPEQVPIAVGRHTDPALPALVHIDRDTHRLIVVPHRLDCPQLLADVERATQRRDGDQ